MGSSIHDFVIANGTIIDGSGEKPYVGNVAVKDGLISYVGTEAAKADTTYEADGLTVTPGFVDVHTHFDGQATWQSELTPSATNGVTTVISGNCGVGFAPVRADDHQRLIDFMEGVEDIPGTVLHEGISWGWESFAEYLQYLDDVPHDIDIGVYAPHTPVRIYVMGDRARFDVPATESEIDRMADIVRQSVMDGAMGFSSSRTVAHRTLAGEHIPTLTAAGEELTTIAGAMGETGRGLVQLVTDFTDAEAEFDLLRHIAVTSGRPVSFALVQNADRPEVYRQVLDMLSNATADGVPMTAQVPVRGVGLVMGLDTSLNPFSRNSVYTAICNEPVARQLSIMKQDGFKERLVEAQIALHESGRTVGRLIYSYERIFELTDPPNYEPGPANSLAARAEREGRHPAELIYEILTEGDGQNLLYAYISNLVPGDLEVVRELLEHPDTVVGLSDAGAHVGIIADGSFPTTLLTHWGRDRATGRIPLERLVRMQTAETARLVGLSDRGSLRQGKRADINVIDMEALTTRRPAMQHDLPAGGRRFVQVADGYRRTFVAGVQTYEDGKPTGSLPGRLIRSSPF
jgi:N-acyl-D-aspartate/D-glutamate deacylase